MLQVGGNCSALLPIDDVNAVVVVSKSGKAPHMTMNTDTDFAIITNFDWNKWSCDYYACDDSVLPTSDAPLHCAVLNARKDMRWSAYPQVVLHGHAFETEDKARACGYPISTDETLFSTPEDTEALMTLLKRYPYPVHEIFVRKGHGFVLLADSTAAAKRVFDSKMKPNLI